MVTNSGERAIGGFFLDISELPTGSEVYNASAALAGGTWRIIHGLPVAPGISVEVMVEYHVLSRIGTFTPALSALHILPVDDRISGAIGFAEMQIKRALRLDDGRMLVEFLSVPGQCYQIQFSDDGQTWHNSLSRLRAGGTRVQWLDSGPPQTPSHPNNAASRFYRAVEKPS